MLFKFQKKQLENDHKIGISVANDDENVRVNYVI